ncbi:hypothetical protein ACIP1T_21370 [Pseudomonas japonica]|uniref:hypothetical protein n=1 Tax=Pseudomonas japonica TaxID=256466 RepID=UPI0038119314
MRATWKGLGILIIACSGLWFASEWWEKGLASSLGDSELSPNGCSRLETFKPFWLLPDFLHPEAAPNDDGEVHWFRGWEMPGFYRLYDTFNGQLIGETVIYDLAFSGGRLSWDRGGGVWVGMTYVGPSIRDFIGAKPQKRSDP